MNVGDIYFALRGSSEQLMVDARKGADQAAAAGGKSFSAKFGAVLGAAFGAGAVAAAKFGGQVDAAFDTIRIGTGATGEALKGLEGDFKVVAGSVRDDLGTTAQVIADLNTRTGQTGEGLRTLAKDILDLSRITKTDAVANVAAATRLFGDWSIATEDQSGALDKLFRTSQATGIGVTNLMETVVQFGSPMRLLGLSFEESIALIGKWEKEGVNTETAMAGLKFSVKTLANEGIKAADMGEAFRRKLDAIKASADPVGESIKLFGLRAGPDLAAAIVEGRFATEDLLAVINDTDETIATATAATEDFGDALAKAFNAAKVEFGAAFSFLGSIGQTLGPLLYVLPALTAGFGKLAGSIVGMAGPALGGLFAKAFAGAQVLGNAIAAALVKIPGMGAVRGAAVAAGSKLGGFMGSSLGKFAAVAFAAVAVVAVVETYNRIKGELGEQSEQIGADIANQIVKGTTAQLEQSRAAVKAGLEKLEGVWDAGIFTGDTRKSLEAQMAALDAELARRAAGIPLTVGGALADGESVVTEGGEQMLDGLDEAFDDAGASIVKTFATSMSGVVQASRVTGADGMAAMAAGIKSARQKPLDAFDTLTEMLKHQMSPSAEAARLAGQLTSKELAAGLKSYDPEVRAQALAVKDSILDRLNELGKAGNIGKNAMAELAEGLKSEDPLIRAAAEEVVATVEGRLNAIDAKEAGAAAAIAYATEFKARVVAALADLRGGTWWSSEKTSVAMPTSTSSRSGGALIRTFHEGTPFVERDQLAFVERGEAIIPAGQNQSGTFGGSGQTNNITVYNPTPEPASTSVARELQNLAFLGAAG
jgi:hypothetical protein